MERDDLLRDFVWDYDDKNEVFPPHPRDVCNAWLVPMGRKFQVPVRHARVTQEILILLCSFSSDRVIHPYMIGIDLM